MYNQDTVVENKKTNILSWVIVTFAAIFYCYEYLLRVSPSVMNVELMNFYKINDFQLANLTAFYYYIYAPMQIPVGLLMDKYGPKYLLVLACFCCSIGTYFFVCTPWLILAQFGRFLVGFGSAFAFVGVLKLSSIYLPKEKFAVVSGTTMALGQLGAVLGDVLLTSIIKYDGWQLACIHSAYFGLFLTIALVTAFNFIGAPNRSGSELINSKEETKHKVSLIISLKELITNKNLWLSSLIGCSLWVPIVVFAEYLGIDFLKSTYNMTSSEAALANSMIFIGMAFGGPTVTSISNYLKSRLLPIKIGCILSGSCFTALLLMNNLSVTSLYILLFFLGFFTSVQVIVFPIAKEIATSSSAATAVAITNMTVMLSGIFFQPVSGYLLSKTSAFVSLNSANIIHHGSDYVFSFSYIPFVIFSTYFLANCCKETFNINE